MADFSVTLAVEGPVKGWKVPPPQLECYIGVKVGNQPIAKTPLNVEPEWEEPVILSNCGSDEQVTFELFQQNPRFANCTLRASCDIQSSRIKESCSREGELRQAMTPSGTLVLRLAGAVRQGENPIEESTMPNRHEKNIEKVFPVFGHRFVAKAFNEFVYCAVDRDFIWGFGKQGLSCEQCGMTLHKWCYTKIVTPCPGSTLSQQGGRDAMKFEARIAHNFKLKTYGKPTFCELCGSLLWGITKQGYQCTSPNCYLNVHNECRENAGNLPCGVDRTKYAAVMLALQKKEEQRMQTLTMYKGKGKNALGIEDFTLKTMLGRGGFGKVILAERKSTREMCAIKIVNKKDILKEDTAETSLLERDVLALGGQSRFITTLFAAFQTTERLFFAMEFVSGGDLFHHIAKIGHFPESTAKFYTAEIVLALQFLHGEGIVHRDLKPDNVMLTREGHVKLTDFGVCKKVKFWIVSNL